MNDPLKEHLKKSPPQQVNFGVNSNNPNSLANLQKVYSRNSQVLANIGNLAGAQSVPDDQSQLVNAPQISLMNQANQQGKFGLFTPTPNYNAI